MSLSAGRSTHIAPARFSRAAAFRSALLPGLIPLAFAAFVSVAAVSAASAQATPANGGSLRIAISSEPTTLMPLSQDINTQYIVAQLYPSLLKFDGKVTPKPYLAKSWTISPDGTTYTFQIADGAKWSDGKPITSEDVKFTFEQMIPKYQPAGEANFSVIESIDASAPAAVVFKLKRPYSPFLSLLNHLYAPILPKHVYEGTVPTSNPNSTSAAVTGGPFMMREWVKGDHITLVRNPNAYDKPYLDEIVIRFITDVAARTLALKTGAIDYLPPGALPYAAITTLRGDANVTVAQVGDEAAGKVLTIGFNTRKAPFDNVKVRQAVSHAIDKKFVAQAAGYTFETPAVGPLNDNAWAWDASLKGYDFDAAKAAKMLDEAGYPVKPDGFRFAMKVLTRPSVAVFHKANEILVQNLKSVGINAALVPLESGPYATATYVEANFDLSSVAWISSFDPNNLVPLYACSSIKPQPYSNFMGYCNKEVDDLFAKGAAEQDPAKRKAIYVQAQQKIIDDAPAIWPMNWSDWSAFRKNVNGMPAGPWDGRDPLDDIWIAGK